jgi:hypothetical protein
MPEHEEQESQIIEPNNETPTKHSNQSPILNPGGHSHDGKYQDDNRSQYSDHSDHTVLLQENDTIISETQQGSLGSLLKKTQLIELEPQTQPTDGLEELVPPPSISDKTPRPTVYPEHTAASAPANNIAAKSPFKCPSIDIEQNLNEDFRFAKAPEVVSGQFSGRLYSKSTQKVTDVVPANNSEQQVLPRRFQAQSKFSEAVSELGSLQTNSNNPAPPKPTSPKPIPVDEKPPSIGDILRPHNSDEISGARGRAQSLYPAPSRQKSLGRAPDM